MSDVSRLVVLGSCGAWPEPSRACSGLVLEHRGFRVVLDLGYATLPRLLELLGSTVADGVDALVVTHQHPDHMIDVHGLFRARWFGRRGAAPIPTYAAEGVRDRLRGWEEDDLAALDEVFDWHQLPGGPYPVGPFTLSSWSLPHFVPNAGVRLSCDDLTVAYTGDTGPDPALVELGRDADLLVAEASDRYQQTSTPTAASGGLHLDGLQAAEAAESAGTRRLLLTHFWPGNDRERTRTCAAAAYRGEILLAEEGLVVELP